MVNRHIFHSYRRPKVSFLLDDTIFSGRLLSYWERGLEILLSTSSPKIKTKSIQNLAFEQNDSGPHIGRLTVASVSENHEGTCIRAICNDDQSATQLTHALKILRTISSNNGKKLRRDKIPRFSRKNHYSQQAISARLSWAREVSGARLENIEKTILKPETLAGNIENYIGAVQIPIGLAGPLHVRGTYIDDYVPLPIATTEGALVSSITRGALACNLAGGVHCRVIRQQMVRAPVFFCESIMGAVNLEQWIYQHLDEIRKKAESVSSVAKLQRVEPVLFGSTLHLRFYYYTGDASGQNMTSACTFVACNWIEEQIKDDPSIGFKWYTIEANMSGDKKANYQNFINGRGVSVTATCFIPGKVLKKILRVEPERFVRIWSEAEFSAGLIGMHGSNINFSNVIAGIFTATGQDIACVHESSGGIFKVNQEGDGLVFTAQLPSLVAGTVGGGTSLPVQRECLELMGCYGSGRLFRFAEIVAAACLALDISTGSAIVTNDFVSAHERLGRNRPRNRLSWSEINERFFAQFFKDQNLEILKAEKAPRKTCSGIISSITKESSSVYGLHRYRLKARNQQGHPFDMKVFLKIKASSRELDRIGLKVAKLTGEDRIPGLYESQSYIFCLEESNLREIAIYEMEDETLARFHPKIHGTIVDHDRELYAILMEDLTGSKYYDSIERQIIWKQEEIGLVLQDMALMHARFMDKFHELHETNVLKLTPEFACGARELLKELTRFNKKRYPELIDKRLGSLLQEGLEGFEEMVTRMSDFAMTLTHNDFNPRNLCFKKTKEGYTTVLYDWELAFFQNPQHDLVEFLLFVLPPEATRADYLRYGQLYLRRLEGILRQEMGEETFFKILDLNALYFALVRMNLYLLGNNILKLDFLPRVYRKLANFLKESFPQGIEAHL